MRMTTQIFVQGPRGPLVFDVDLRETGLDMKVRIFERTGIMPHRMWLSAGRSIIYDYMPLCSLGIQRDDVIRCHAR
jgi:hypothetical protein